MNDQFDRLTAALADRYRLERELGHGGMATVYLADDLKHDRKVALKVLRPELAAVIGAERFLAEIKTTANLQHPHILALFDSGAVDSFLFYVMPFIDGESLRDRLHREKQLPIADAVRIASEVAGALDYAHRHGVIHRDIKPENILLHDGRALVADFGIALAASKAGGSRMTETGLSLGTPQYMSPEQAMAEREITARSDVYALGCVLYEMLVGEPPFTGPTAQAIVAKTMTADPLPPSAARRMVSPEVDEAVLTALQRLPADRFATAADFGAAIAGRQVPGRGGQRFVAARGRQTFRHMVQLGWGIALVATSLALWGWLRPAGQQSLAPSRLAIPAPGGGGTGAAALARQLTLTPDGGTVIFPVVGPDGLIRLMRRPLDAEEPTVIAGTEGMVGPVVSPDGKSLIATSVLSRQSSRFSLVGGTPMALPEELSAGMGATVAWGPDGTVWDASAGFSGRGLVHLVGGDSLVWLFPETTSQMVLQQILPGGSRALMVRRGATVSGPPLLFDLERGTSVTLLDRQVIEVRYTSGYLVYVLPDGTMQAVAFDLKAGRITGDAVPIATDISLTGNGIAQFAVADNGTLAYLPEEPRTLVFIDRRGGIRQATDQRHNFHAPRYSPDGHRLSLDFNSADGRDVWILSPDQGALTRATFDHDGHDATWTPDGRFLTYTSTKSGTFGIYRLRPGAAAPAESLLASAKLAYTGLWLPDGSGLLTEGLDLVTGSGLDVGVIRNGGHGPIEPLVASRFEEAYASFSPDGRWICFASTQSGPREVYVRRFAGEGDQIQVSLDGGTEPIWSPDGSEIFYRSEVDGQPLLMAAQVRTRPAFEVTGHQKLFSLTEMVGTTPHANYDVSPDGKTFVMVRRSPATRIMVIQHLPELVRRLHGTTGAAP